MQFVYCTGIKRTPGFLRYIHYKKNKVSTICTDFWRQIHSLPECKKEGFCHFLNLFSLKNRLYKDRKQCITFYSLLKTEWKIKFHSALSFEMHGIYSSPKKQFQIFSSIYMTDQKLLSSGKIFFICYHTHRISRSKCIWVSRFYSTKTSAYYF